MISPWLLASLSGCGHSAFKTNPLHFAYLRARLGTSFSEKKWVTRRWFVGGLLLWYDAQNFLILNGYLRVKVSFEKIERGLAPGGYILR